MTNHAHILLKSGQQGLAKFMRRFLTGLWSQLKVKIKEVIEKTCKREGVSISSSIATNASSWESSLRSCPCRSSAS